MISGVLMLFLVACSLTDAPTTPVDSGSTSDTSVDVPTGTTSSGTPVVEPGELVISEFMEDPLAVDGDFGEYLELTSIASRPLDLEGLTLIDDDGDGFTITGALPLAVGGTVVFGPSDNLVANGGVAVDYPYSIDALKLGNEGDTVAVLRGAVPIDVVSYADTSWTLVEGVAQSLSPAAFDPVSNDDLASWCGATSPFGLGDHGTPGAPNDPCE